MKLGTVTGFSPPPRPASACGHHPHDHPCDRVSLGGRPSPERRLSCGDIARIRGSASTAEPQVQMGATSGPQLQMTAGALAFTGGNAALQMSASMAGHAAACMQCNINWHCILEPGHSGAHACAQGHRWW